MTGYFTLSMLLPHYLLGSTVLQMKLLNSNPDINQIDLHVLPQHKWKSFKITPSPGVSKGTVLISKNVAYNYFSRKKGKS